MLFNKSSAHRPTTDRHGATDQGDADIRQSATQTAASTVQLEKAMVSLTAQSQQLAGIK